MATLSQLLSTTPPDPDAFGDYFSFIDRSLKVIQDIRVQPICEWDKMGGNEFELCPPAETPNPEAWVEQVRRALRMVGSSLSIYHVKPDQLEERYGRLQIPPGLREEAVCEVHECDPDELCVTLTPGPADDEVLFIEIDDRNLRAQKNALQTLQKNTKPAHRGLLNLFSRNGSTEDAWAPFFKQHAQIDDWKILNPAYPGAQAQMDFIKAAMQTPDFVLLKGPPGSGKTTAISELVLQMAIRRPLARILLTASTHVAIDNVLEKIAKYADQVTCIRIASEQTAGRVEQPEVKAMLLKNVVAQERARLTAYHSSPTSPAEKAFRALLDSSDGANALKQVILASATLAAGTPQGILSHPAIKQRPEDGYAMPPCFFDMIIVDEASKTSLLEFLIPAVHAQTWVIVGDDRQLPPYMGRPDVAAGLRALSPESSDADIDQTAGQLVRWRENFFQQLDSHKLTLPDPRLEQAARLMRKICLPSIYGLLSQGHGLDDLPIPLTLGLPAGARSIRSFALTHQNRMHPDISAFPREAFYSPGRSAKEPLLLDSPIVHDRPWPLADLFPHRSIWLDIPTPSADDTPQRSQRGESNAAEAYAIARYLLLISQRQPTASLAVICFYKAQRNLIRNILHELADENGVAVPASIEYLTVDSCQGREADVVFVSFTLARGSRFVRDPNRLNVAITRARHQLVLVGNHGEMTRHFPKWGEERNYLHQLALHHHPRKYSPTNLLADFRLYQGRAKKAQGKRPRAPHQPVHDGRSKHTPRNPPPPGRLDKPFDGLDPKNFSR